MRAPRPRLAAALPAALALVLGGCSAAGLTVPGGAPSGGVPGASAGPSSAATPAYPFTPAATPTILPSGYNAKPSTGGPTLAPTAGGPLNGKVVVVDPGHNGGFNPALHNKRVPSALGLFQCMASGTEADDQSVAEHDITWAVGQKLADDLRAQGATVILTRPDDTGVGPCNATRAEIANAAHADFLMSVHVDGERLGRNGIADPRGFHVQLEKKMVGGQAVYDRSFASAQNVVRRMLELTNQPLTNYVPRKPAGIWQRSGDLTVLAGLKTTPGVLVEMGNIKNPKDLAELVDPTWQASVATALTAAIEDSLLVPEHMTPTPLPTTPSATPSGAPSGAPSAAGTPTLASASATTATATPTP